MSELRAWVVPSDSEGTEAAHMTAVWAIEAGGYEVVLREVPKVRATGSRVLVEVGEAPVYVIVGGDDE